MGPVRKRVSMSSHVRPRILKLRNHWTSKKVLFLMRLELKKKIGFQEVTSLYFSLFAR